MAETEIGGIAWVVDADTSPAVNSTKQLDTTINNTTTTLKKLDTQTTKTSRAVKAGLASIGKRAGQAGIQIQQFIGQVQGGQSAMLALSQQSADLGFVLGAPLLGAVAGIAASLAGMLLPSLFDTEDAMSDIEKATEHLAATFTLSSDGVVKYTEKMQTLAAVSQGLARIKLQNTIDEQKELMKKAGDEISTAFNDAIGKNLTAAGFEKVFGKYSDEIAIFVSDTQDMLKNISAEGVSDENINKLTSALSKARDMGLSTTESGRELIDNLTKLVVTYKQGEKAITDMTDRLKENELKLKDSNSNLAKYDALIKTLTVRSNKLRSAQLEQEKALTLEKAAQDGVNQEKIKAISSAYDNVIAIEKEKEALSAKTKAQREAAKAQRDADKAKRESAQKARATIKDTGLSTRGAISSGESTEVQAKTAEIEKLKALRDDDLANRELYDNAIQSIQNNLNQTAIDYTKGIIDSGKTEIQLIQDKFDKLQEYRNNDLINDQRYTAAKAELEKQRMSIVTSSLGTFSNAFDTMANVMSNSMGEQSSAYKTMFAISKAFSIAQATMNIATAISNASASGPFPANLGFMATMAAQGASILSSIQAVSYVGREHGGSMLANQTYEVGEKNKPELLMIPGNNGKMFSNSEVKNMMSGGSGGGFKQTIINTVPGAEVQTRGDGITAEQTVTIVRTEMSNPNSRTRRGMGQTSNVRSRPKISRG